MTPEENARQDIDAVRTASGSTVQTNAQADLSAATVKQPVRATRYYRLDSRKVTFREYWNIARSWKVIIPWTAKLLRLPMRFVSGMPHFDSVRELRVAEADFPAEVREKLQPLCDLSQRIGFHSPQFHTYASMRGESRTSFITLLHPSGATLRLMCNVSGNVHPPKVKMLAVLLSELSDGTFFFTSDQRPQMLSAPGILANRLEGASLARLMESHLQKLEEFKSRNPPKRIESVEALDRLWDRYERLSREFGMKRGVYVWMSPEEVAGEQKQLDEVKTEAGPAAKNLEVLLELNNLQNKKAGWGAVITILVVSLVLFIGAGSQQSSWDYLLILVPVLFVHELGHYLAMRVFHYRNLRMFFIPFFGAAVSGQHYNVPGWKKAIVSLMGPVPGIILGVIIGGAGLILHQALLTKVAVVALILNGFNLLPVLPFDGGWVFHTLLFSRHYLLDSAFRVLAACALGAAGMFSENKFLMYLSIPMFMSIPAAYRTARIAATVRGRGLPPASADAQTIPSDTAEAIIGEVKKANQKLQSNKMLAQQTLQVFETLNARPPGWAATLGLLFAYFTSLGLAAVFAGVFVFGQRGDLQRLLAKAAAQPRRNLVCGATSSWRGMQAAGLREAAQATVIANFPKRGEAEKSFQELTNRLPASASAKVLGDSILLAFPAAEAGLRRLWFAELQLQTKLVFVDSSNNPATLSLSWQLAEEKEAKELEEELKEYFSANRTGLLIPPWHPHDRRTPAQRAAHQLARKTYLKAQAERVAAYNDPSLHSLQKQLNAAKRQGDEAEAAALRQQLARLSAGLTKERMEKLKTGIEGPVDPAVLDLITLSTSMNATNREAKQKLARDLAEQMGPAPGVNGVVDSVENRFSTRAGIVSRKGRTLQLSWASFRRISDGAPVLLDWLCAKGGTDFKYDLRAGASYSTDEKP